MQVDIAENSQPEFLSSFNLEGAEQRSFSQTTMTADIKILDTLESEVQKFFFSTSQSIMRINFSFPDKGRVHNSALPGRMHLLDKMETQTGRNIYVKLYFFQVGADKNDKIFLMLQFLEY